MMRGVCARVCLHTRTDVRVSVRIRLRPGVLFSACCDWLPGALRTPRSALWTWTEPGPMPLRPWLRARPGWFSSSKAAASRESCESRRNGNSRQTSHQKNKLFSPKKFYARWSSSFSGASEQQIATHRELRPLAHDGARGWVCGCRRVGQHETLPCMVV